VTADLETRRGAKSTEGAALALRMLDTDLDDFMESEAIATQ
jgi:hypothetical protein